MKRHPLARGRRRVFAVEPMHLFRHRIYRRPLRSPLRTAHGMWTERAGIIVRLEDADGRAGFGEIAPIPEFGTETLEEADALCRSFGSRLDDETIGRVAPRFGCVRFALAEARRKPERPVHKMEPLPIAALLPAGKAVIKTLADRIEGGFLAVKWKVGVEDSDLELGLLDEVSSMLPAYVKLRLDANGAWNRKLASRWLDRCAERAIEFVEQPLAPEDRDGLRGLAEDFPVKIALDESVVRIEEAQRWQAEGWNGVFVIKPALCGPLDDLRAWIADSRADVVLSSAVETSVGRAAILGYVQSHNTQLTRRALGFGMGAIFGDATWDGPAMGPLLDASWQGSATAEELWNALG